MRIAIVAPPWFPVPPRDYGGTERVCDLLARALQERSHEVILFATGDSTTEVELRPTIRRHKPQHFRRLEREGRHLAAVIDEADCFDAIHDNTTAYGAYVWSLTGAPVLHTVHLPPDDEDRLPLYRRAGKRIGLVAVSGAQRKLAPRLPWLATIPNPVQAPGSLPEASPSGGQRHLLFLGRICPRKGAEVAIEAARLAGMRLVLAGPVYEEDRDYFAQRVQPTIDGDSVAFVGPVGERGKAELLTAARAVLFPAQWEEPFGLVALEAMAAGVPVVACPRGALSEIVSDGETGFLADDAVSMAAAVERTAEIEPERCREEVAANYSPESVAERYEEALEAVAAGPPPAAVGNPPIAPSVKLVA